VVLEMRPADSDSVVPAMLPFGSEKAVLATLLSDTE
jgi:hypothetical protein